MTMETQQENIWAFERPSDPSLYVYEAMAEHVAGLITSGQLEARSMLPSESELAKSCRVSLGTARHATAVLRERGFVVTVRSKGTFVRDATSRKRDNREVTGLTLLNREAAG